ERQGYRLDAHDGDDAERDGADPHPHPRAGGWQGRPHEQFRTPRATEIRDLDLARAGPSAPPPEPRRDRPTFRPQCNTEHDHRYRGKLERHHARQPEDGEHHGRRSTDSFDERTTALEEGGPCCQSGICGAPAAITTA